MPRPRKPREHGMYGCTGEGCGICRRNRRLSVVWYERKANGSQPGATHWTDWTPEEDKFLRERAGHLSLAQIARDLAASKLSLRTRTRQGVMIRCQKLGLDMRPLDVTPLYLAGQMGVDAGTVNDTWIRRGWLEARVWESKMRVISREAIERFLRECGWLYDIERIVDPGLKAYAQQHQRDPWLPQVELARFLGFQSVTSLRRWRLRGLVPHRMRPDKAGGKNGVVYVRASDFLPIKERIEAAVAEYHQRRSAMVRGWNAQTARRKERVA